MPAHLTPAEARALGVAGTPPASPGRTRKRGTRKAVPGHGVTRCYDCGQVFTTTAAETRHVAPGHCRFETVTPGVYAPPMSFTPEDPDPDAPSPDPDPAE